MAIIGTFSYEFRVTIPLFATQTFHGNAGAYAALTAAQGIGAVVGGAFTASRRRADLQVLVISAGLFGISIVIASSLPSLNLAMLGMVVVGFFSVNYTSLGNTTLQLSATPEMRGRVMSLWTVAFMGSTPIGGPIMGWVAEVLSPRWSLNIGGVCAIVAALVGVWVLRRVQTTTIQIA
jgi:predicted MFS family arabinose efflux permease